MAAQRPAEVHSTTENYPELGRTGRPYVPARQLTTDYPLIDSDPHFKRVVSYARASDYIWGLTTAPLIPAGLYVMERVSPSEVAPRHFASVMRLCGTLGVFGGFFMFYTRSINRFYGFSENRREVEMDMREMTDRVKAGLPLYGASSMTEYMQGVASRQSRYSGVWLANVPWFNFVNHAQHGVDTAKYYQNAERELEAERRGKA
nr:nadh-ubiquinone oxidoreductase 20.9 kda subunit [Quercus suber]